MDIEQYSEIAPQYYKNVVPSLLRKYLKGVKGISLLDCGCGDGSLLYALKRNDYFEGNKIFAIDLSKKRIELVRRIDQTIHAAVDSAESIESIVDNSIDFFISTQVIEHVDQKKMLASIDRVVRGRGKIYLATVFKKWYGWYFYKNQEGKWVIDPTHVREYTHDSQLFSDIDWDKFRLIENRKTLLWFPVIDFFIKRTVVKNRRILDTAFGRFLRTFQVPIIGYYNWEIILEKNEIISTKV